jgi:hypothetical protein
MASRATVARIHQMNEQEVLRALPEIVDQLPAAEDARSVDR